MTHSAQLAERVPSAELDASAPPNRSHPPAARGSPPIAPEKPDVEHHPAGDEPEPRTKAAGRPRKARRLLLIGCALLALLGGGGWYGWRWYTVGRFLVETDDAYTQADDIIISPQVSGYVSELLVTDNQPVRRGDVIARIDDRVFRALVDQARAERDVQVANERNVAAQIARQGSVIAQMEAEVASAQARLAFAAQEDARSSALVQRGTGTVQRAQQTQSTLRASEAELAKSKANLAAARQQLDVLRSQREQARAAIEHAAAALDQAKINLGYTTITAPRDGTVGDRSVRLGQLVQPGTRLLTLVPMREVYVVANYKETQLARMASGQPVEISVDGYPDASVRGRVDSLAPGSGAQFALLPPENATGNFTKIVQRVPVKIVLDHAGPLAGRLRPGLSVTTSVDVRGTPILAQRPDPQRTAAQAGAGAAP